jgi:hypothetical protein
MRWLRDAGWVVAVGAVIALAATRPDRKPLPDPNESRAAFERSRAEFEEKRAKREEETEREISRIRTEATLDLLRSVGRGYHWHLAREKSLPRAEDFEEALGAWRSHRDDRPFVILWGVDLGRLPGGGAGLLLAWEQTTGRGGTRCVLMADGKTAKVVPEEEFTKLPRAK